MTEQTQLTRETVVETMRSERFVMLTSVSTEGTLQSHPMTPQQVTDEADVWFFTGLDTDLAEQLRTSPEVNLAFAETGSWLSVSGRVEFVEDRAKVDELWNQGVSAWFDGEKDDPRLGLLRFTGESAQFWGQPGGKAKALVGVLRARVTGERPAGQSGTVQL